MKITNQIALAAIFAAAACGGGAKDADKSSAAPAAVAAPVATGEVHEITATTDDKGNYFSPKEITAKAGDILRVKLVTGVHNVHFLPDSNKSAKGLPEASVLLQLPGQTVDIPLTFGTGKFFFQCDPHALLGMVGHVTFTP
jgi:plastocyanin